MSEPAAAPLIFVVDDDPDIGDLVVDMLAPLGLRVQALTDPAAVVGLALEQQPDLILLDIVMPRLDGHTVATQLRADRRTAGIPVVFLTAAMASSHRAVSLMLGALAHLQKPFTQETLAAAVQEALSR